MAKHTLWLSVASMVVGVVGANPLGAVTITNMNLGMLTSPTTSTGALANQGVVLEESFSITSATKLSIFTDSYGGGMNVNGTTASRGGFMPSLVLYNAAGNYVAGEIFPYGNTDPVTGLAGDAAISSSSMLAAGSYILTVSDWQVQQPVTATNLSDGFIDYGSASVFSDVQGNVRNGNYSVNLSSSSSAATPEPATLWLMIPALGGLAALVRKRKIVRS